MKFFSFILSLFLCLSSKACTKNKPERDFKPEISAKLVKEGALLIDVRSNAEFKLGHVEGAVNIPHAAIGSQKELLKQLTKGNKNKTIVVYCKSGKRAGKAKEALQNLGYTNIVNHGGFVDWKK